MSEVSEASLRLGDKVDIDIPHSAGIHHADSGISICADTREGKLLSLAGIFYICPHGRGCTDRSSRETFCPECRETAEQEKALSMKLRA